MTAYWNTTAVMRALPQEQRTEIMHAHHGIPIRTLVACHRATSQIPADTTMAFISSQGVGLRRAYLQHPSFEQWMALERGGFVEIWDSFGFVMDALH